MKVIPNAGNENIKRINEIYQVLKKNDFGYLIEENTFFKRFPFLRNRKAKEEGIFPDESIPLRFRRVLEELGPAYIKLGQMLSTRPDLVGVEIAEELQKLRDNTPTTPFDEIKKVIESELQLPIDEVYSEIDEEPIGSASIGQVYKAKLKSTGEDVAIKVQKPNSREVIESDVRIMKFLAIRIDRYLSITQTYNLPAMVSEFERSIFKEINYLEEVMNMQNLSKNFKNVSYIKIPKAYTDYCTEKLITMELIDGIVVSDLMEGDYPEINKKKIASYGVKSYFKQIMTDGFFHADPHPGNLIVTEDQKLCYIDEGMMGILNDDFKENLAELILLLISGNTNNIIKQLIYMDIITPAQNTDELKADVDDLLTRYYGAELKNMDGAMEDLLNVMVKNKVVLPREFVMIGRGITLIEDTGKKLDPKFNAATELKKLSRKIVINKYKPERLAKVSMNYLLQLEHLAKDLPETINSTISKIEEGNLEVNLNHLGISELINQLSVALIVSALIVGSSLAILSEKGPQLWGMPALGLIGFVFSAILGAYLVIEYMIERD
ncbi:MAG: AarF/ABC1/UbiB kinase family protein [Methanobrevibacter thaueri]|jgi:ubiquinone biosynthesis protein|uniref:ABC1 kinase family protein n=1 Tax=Methanobrevibacter thaueri TaxID=190975 RepID=UPI0026EA690E|nr:AarF/ABC1/UbiB kinase family protein [Methanobrevibacter thaueri]MBE6495307.1 AarF/ABC1/UbiB kinase family protein [Methanobrevibacter thaueri]